MSISRGMTTSVPPRTIVSWWASSGWKSPTSNVASGSSSKVGSASTSAPSDGEVVSGSAPAEEGVVSASTAMELLQLREGVVRGQAVDLDALFRLEQGKRRARGAAVTAVDRADVVSEV